MVNLVSSAVLAAHERLISLWSFPFGLIDIIHSIVEVINTPSLRPQIIV